MKCMDGKEKLGNVEATVDSSGKKFHRPDAKGDLLEKKGTK